MQNRDRFNLLVLKALAHLVSVSRTVPSDLVKEIEDELALAGARREAEYEPSRGRRYS